MPTKKLLTWKNNKASRGGYNYSISEVGDRFHLWTVYGDANKNAGRGFNAASLQEAKNEAEDHARRQEKGIKATTRNGRQAGLWTGYVFTVTATGEQYQMKSGLRGQRIPAYLKGDKVYLQGDPVDGYAIDQKLTGDPNGHALKPPAVKPAPKVNNKPAKEPPGKAQEGRWSGYVFTVDATGQQYQMKDGIRGINVYACLKGNMVYLEHGGPGYPIEKKLGIKKVTPTKTPPKAPKKPAKKTYTAVRPGQVERLTSQERAGLGGALGGAIGSGIGGGVGGYVGAKEPSKKGDSALGGAVGALAGAVVGGLTAGLPGIVIGGLVGGGAGASLAHGK